MVTQPMHPLSLVIPVVSLVPVCSVAAVSPCKPRKPTGFWNSSDNLHKEIRTFITEYGDNVVEGHMPPASKFRTAGRMDIIQAIHNQGGFVQVAKRMQLANFRRPKHILSSPINRAVILLSIQRDLLRLAVDGHLPPGYMPSASQLRRLGQSELLKNIVFVGGFSVVSKALALTPAQKKGLKSDQASWTYPTRIRRPKHYWKSWRVVETELYKFANENCDGFMPLQRHFIENNRTDLLNAIRQHGGLACAAKRSRLQPPLNIISRRPRAYWRDPAILNGEILAFTAKYGHPGIMPTSEGLRRAGRTDLLYAIRRYGGFSALAARLHLIWYGPSSFWRAFRNLRSRLLVFLKSQGNTTVMPSVQELHKLGRFDLVYGIALHGGVMAVSRRMGLSMSYSQRDEEFWRKDTSVLRELQEVLHAQPLEVQHIMPTSVKLIQLGRADLATAIRDHGGWIHYAQCLNLRFAFDVHPRGYWLHDTNVLKELLSYIDARYGNWEFPGKPPCDWDARKSQNQALKFVPSSDMLKRDGRSDIAFAIERYHGGMEEFANKHNFVVAQDIVTTAPFEKLSNWSAYVQALEAWIDMNGTKGIMPSKQSLIMCGRHDLRRATWKHGGHEVVSKRLQLILPKAGVKSWLPQWLGIQAGKLGLIHIMQSKKSLQQWEVQMLQKYEDDLNGSIIGKRRRATEMGSINVSSNEIVATRKNVRKSSTTPVKRLSKLELDRLRERYRHIPPDDLIAVA